MRCTECNGVIKPVVGVDVDGTLAAYHRHFFKFASDWLGLVPGTWERIFNVYDGSQELSTFMGLDKRTYRQIKLAYRQGGMKRSMPTFPGANNLLSVIKNLGVEVWITTTRPYLQVGNVDEDTREWLRRHSLPYDHIVYEDDKYGTLVEQVGLERIVCVLEDQSEDLVRAREVGIEAAIFRRTSWNAAQVPPDYPLVAWTLTQASEMISELINDWKMHYEFAED